MREIKFRYWLKPKRGGVFAAWLTLQEIEGWPYSIKVDGNILARDQWTGLTDRNGQDIYENDVLSRNRGLNPFVVEYNHCNAAFEARGEPGTGWGASHWSHCEVVGNIIHEQESVQ